MARVGWLFEFGELNGAERSLLATLDGVREAGFDPLAIAPTSGPLRASLQSGGVEHIPFDVRDPSGRRRDGDELRHELTDLLSSQKLDLVHANSLSMGRLSGPVVAGIHLPSIAHLRDILRLSRQAVTDLNRHTRLLAVSQAVHAFHVAQGLDDANTHVIYNGIDLDAFQPRTPSGFLHKQLGLSDRAVLFGSIGQIGLRKGQNVLLEAFARITDKHAAAHLLIVGRRHSQKDEARRFEEDLHHRATKGDLSGRVHFLGECDDVAHLLPELHALVHAARQEPLGRVLLEAAACGLPVVATDVGGTREIFPTENEGGLLVAADDVEGFASSWGRLLNDRSLHARLSSAGRARAVKQFAIQRAAGKLAAQYKTVIAEAG